MAVCEQVIETDQITGNNVSEVTNYHAYYLYRNAMGKWKNFNIAISTNWMNNVTFA